MTRLLVCLLIVTFSRLSSGDIASPHVITVTDAVDQKAFDQKRGWLIPPAGTMNAGSHIRFFMSPGDGVTDQIQIGDIGLWDLWFRISFKHFEVGTATSLLIKQTDNSNVWQRTSLSAKIRLADWFGIESQAMLGTTLHNDGVWMRGYGAALARFNVGALGLEASTGLSALHIRDGSGTSAVHLRSSFKTVWKLENVALWLGLTHEVGLTSAGPFKSATALGLEYGAVLTVKDKIDTYFSWGFFERGPSGSASKKLSILTGGFSHSQFMFGVGYNL